MMRERVESNGRFGPNPPAAVTEAVLANFHTQEDGTIQSNLRRENHLRIIDALWDHKPAELYGRLQCPVLILPARQSNPDAGDRRFRREESIARAESLLPSSKSCGWKTASTTCRCNGRSWWPTPSVNICKTASWAADRLGSSARMERLPGAATPTRRS